MKKTTIWALAALLAVGMTGSAEAVSTVHKLCNDCHMRGMKLKEMPLDDLCLGCHPANETDHKLGVVPKIMPKGLPLDRENRITCITCHEPHGRGTTGKLLRLDQNTLCVSCHPV